VLLVVEVREPADERRRRRCGEQVGGDGPADGDGRGVQLLGDDAEDWDDGGLQYRHRERHHAQRHDQESRTRVLLGGARGARARAAFSHA
jgi:hypothetical protein